MRLTGIRLTNHSRLADLSLEGRDRLVLVGPHSADVVGAFPPDCIASVRVGGKVVQPAVSFLSSDERMVVRWWVRRGAALGTNDTLNQN